jgi:DNA-binding HxlR family transcriptional regulator
MAFSKARLFEKSLFQKASYSKTLAHPARILIIEYLLEHGTTRFDDLARGIPLADTTISQHLRQLRQEGLLRVKEIFPHTYYTPNKKACQLLSNQITGLSKSLSKFFPIDVPLDHEAESQVKKD